MSFVRLPYIKDWSYESSPSTSKPLLAGNGILVNLDAVSKVEIHGKANTLVDGKQIPLSFDDIKKYWMTERKEIQDIKESDPVPPYDPIWDERKIIQQIRIL